MPPKDTWVDLVDAALREDLGTGDVTSEILIPVESSAQATLLAREDLVIAGLEVAALIFARFGVALEPNHADGEVCPAGESLARVNGPARGILSAERTALNFLQHLCGIATLTQRFCKAVQGTRATIVDTRKTTPGWRLLEKYAVRCGGGTNHRLGLHDGILIKDNHIRALGSVADALKRAKQKAPRNLKIQVEVENLPEAESAIEAGADSLLLDNMSPRTLRKVVERVAGRVPLEASGGITLESVAEVAATGVDRISIGALTHSARSVDIALEWKTTSSS